MGPRRRRSVFGRHGIHAPFRPRITVPTLVGVLTITLHAYGDAAHLLRPGNLRVFVLAEAALLLLLSGGYLMNDLLDLPYDRVNRPQTVYIGPAISAKAAAVVSAALFCGALVLAALAGRAVLAVMALQAAGLAAYNSGSKRLSYFKPLVASLLFVSIYPLSLSIAGGGVPGPRRDSLLIFPVWLYLTVLSYELVMDARDWKGDARSGVAGFAGRFGAERMTGAARILAALALPIAFVPYLGGMCGGLYLAGAIFAAISLCGSFLVPRVDFVTVLHCVVIPIVISSLVDVLAASWLT